MLWLVNLGDSIRRAREKRDWTQDELAHALGVSTMTIRNWESGRHSPKNALARIEELLGFSVERPEKQRSSPLTKVSDAQLIGELIHRLHTRTVEIAELRREVEDLEAGRVINVDGERWAARLRATDELPTPISGGDDADGVPDKG
jgi:transcriptional regulator with XRE-family HTH domain